MSTSIEEVLVPKLRRAIGDTEEPYQYNDTILAEYIADSVESLKLLWNHDYEVDWDTLTITPEVEPYIQHVFILNSRIDLYDNRPNLNFSVGSLSVRRTGALDNREELEDKLKLALRRLKEMNNLGKSSTEFDTYANRLEDWLERLLY